MPDRDAENGDRNLTRETLAGLQWTYGQAVVTTGLQIVVAAVLARLVSPEDFGLLALGMLTLRFVNYLARGGLTQAVVQKPDLTRTDVRVSMTASTLLGVVFTLVVIAAAPVAGRVFDNAAVVPVVRWLSLTMLLTNLGATADAVLRRQMRFATIALREVVSYVVGYAAVGLSLAAHGAGVWALVAASVTQVAIRSTMTYAAARHSLVPSLDRGSLRVLIGFGGRVSFISFFEFLGSELDTLAVGRYTTAGAVGLYNRAYYLVSLPVHHLQTSFSKVLFPAFSSLQSDLIRLRPAYLSAVRMASALILPTLAGMAVASREIVLVLLGDQWIDAIPVVPWIALSGALATINHFAGITAEARGALNPKIGIVVTKVIALVGLLSVAARHGDLWLFGASLACSNAVAHLLYLALMRRVVETRGRDIAAAYLPSMAGAAVTAGAVALVRVILVSLDTPLLLTLVGEVVAGGTALVALSRFGVLRGARRDVAVRLGRAGLLSPDTRAGRMLSRVLVAPGEWDTVSGSATVTVPDSTPSREPPPDPDHRT